MVSRGLNRANPKKLTEWSFVVIDAAESNGENDDPTPRTGTN